MELYPYFEFNFVVNTSFLGLFPLNVFFNIPLYFEIFNLRDKQAFYIRFEGLILFYYFLLFFIT